MSERATNALLACYGYELEESIDMVMPVICADLRSSHFHEWKRLNLYEGLVRQSTFQEIMAVSNKRRFVMCFLNLCLWNTATGIYN